MKVRVTYLKLLKLLSKLLEYWKVRRDDRLKLLALDMREQYDTNL